MSGYAYNLHGGDTFQPSRQEQGQAVQLTTEDVEKVINSGERLIQGDKRESRSGNLRAIWMMIGPYALVVTVMKARGR